MKGAVQGVATRTERAPVPSPPMRPPKEGPPTAKTPERFSPTASISQAMPATKTGEVNWKPQPAATPAARAATSAPPMARKASTTPAAWARAAPRTAARGAPERRAMPMAFIARTGKTQGMRLRISPPSAAQARTCHHGGAVPPGTGPRGAERV